MTIEQIWNKYQAMNQNAGDEYQAWAFGGNPDGLAKLVLNGEKTATSSAYPLYETQREPLPKVGDYSIILNTKEEPMCIIRTTNIQIVPFLEVSESHARKEGEGDKSLSYWRNVHEEFFAMSLKELELDFDDSMYVVCEEFEMVYQEETPI